MIADNAIYVDGRRAAQQPSSLQETYEALRQLDDGVAWIDLYEPTNEEFESVAQELELPPRMIEGAIKPSRGLSSCATAIRSSSCSKLLVTWTNQRKCSSARHMFWGGRTLSSQYATKRFRIWRRCADG